MKSIREELQEWEDEQMGGYQLKTNEELIDIISEFGNGETEFHTVDINRLVVENERVLRYVKELEQMGQIYSLPGNATAKYEPTYVKHLNNIVKHLNNIFK